MAKRRSGSKGGGATPVAPGCCRVDSLVSVDERGQMVLPKDVRDRAGIGPGEKLALVSWDCGGDVCCLLLMKAERLSGMVKSFLGPVLGGILPEGERGAPARGGRRSSR